MNGLEKAFLITLTLITFVTIIQIILESPRFNPLSLESHDFCVNQGYDSTSYGGEYSNKFKKINCASCYKGECIFEEFNVIIDWRGNFHILNLKRKESKS